MLKIHLDSNLEEIQLGSEKKRKTCFRMVALAVIGLALIALLVLLGWAFSLDALKAGIPGSVAMNPLTALAFLAAAASLDLQRRMWAPRLAITLGALVALIGGWKLLSLVFEFDFLDRFFFSSDLGDNEMAPNTAAGFLLMGIALTLCRNKGRLAKLCEAAALGGIWIGGLALIGFAYGSSSFHTVANFISMSFLTALLLLVLGTGILFLKPDRGLVGLLTDAGPGSAMLRAALPFAVLVPVLLGFVRLYGERLELYGRDTGVSLFVTVLIPGFVALVVRFAREQNKNDLLFQNQSEVLRSVLHRLSDGVLVADTSGQVVLKNPVAQVLLPEHGKLFARSLTGEEVNEEELKIAGPDGKGRYLSVSERPLFGPSGEVMGAVAVVRDSTSQKLAESQLREEKSGLEREVTAREGQLAVVQGQLLQLQKMDAIGRLAGGMAHDFNNILAALEMYCEVMLSSLEKPGLLRESIGEIQQIIGRGADLTRQLLVFSRKQIVEVQATHVSQLIQNMEKMLRRLLTENIQLETRFDSEAGFIRADPGQIEQVVLNLVVNARDAMPKGGRITIETQWVELDEAFTSTHLSTKPGSHVMLSVSDTGAGMNPETKARLFEPFFTTKEIGKGTGLGLSTVYGIVKQFGGSIWVYSEEEKGAVFKIYFPELETAEVRRIQEPQPVAVEASKGARILLVDDDARLGELYAKILMDRGFEVLRAGTAEEAFQLAEQDGARLELLITDVMMPGTNGFDLARKVQENWPHIKALFISGYADQSHSQIIESLEIRNFYLQKPFSANALVAKISEVLASR